MRGRLRTQARRLLAGAAMLLAALTVATAGALAASHPPARMLVYAQEWSLWPSRHSVAHGHVIVQLWNRGQDGHDLHIRRLDRRGHMVGSSQAVPLTISGAISQATWHLAAGRYELFCSMPGHRARGMHTILIVH